MPHQIRDQRIVLVDDDPMIGEALYNWFHPHNKVFNFASAEQLSGSLATLGQVDVFIIDYKLPGKDGLALLAQLRKAQPTAKFIMITGQMDYDLAEKSLEFGLDALILKPFDFNILEENISKILTAVA